MSVCAVSAAVVLLAAGPSDAAFADWARARMIPLEPRQRAFRSLDRVVGQARLIGVGESFHETEPFASFRRELLQDLVKRQRVTALILEAGLPDVMAVDDYVRGRTATVDYATAIPGDLGSLEEIRATMAWLREWNLGPGRARPVGVYGSDLPGRQGSLVPALDRLHELAAGDRDVEAAIEAVRPLAEQIGDRWWRPATQKYQALTAGQKEEFTAQLAALAERVNRLGGGHQRFAWARRVAAVAQQHERSLRLGFFHPSAPRDEAMAENIEWLLERLPAGERAVYWAHNAHVQRALVTGAKLPPGRYPSTGTHLGKRMGPRYLAIGTAYGGPARDDSQPAAAGSVDGVLESVSAQPFVLVLRNARKRASVEGWLSQQRLMRFQAGSLELALGEAFDVLVFFDRATPAARAKPV